MSNDAIAFLLTGLLIVALLIMNAINDRQTR